MGRALVLMKYSRVFLLLYQIKTKLGCDILSIPTCLLSCSSAQNTLKSVNWLVSTKTLLWRKIVPLVLSGTYTLNRMIIEYSAP